MGLVDRQRRRTVFHDVKATEIYEISNLKHSVVWISCEDENAQHIRTTFIVVVDVFH